MNPASDWHIITSEGKMVTNAMRGDHQEYETPTVSRTHGRKKWGRTHSTARKGFAQDRKPTERVAINRVTRKATTQRVWSY